MALALVKGIREPHEVKKKSFDLSGNRTHDLRIRSTVTLPTELRGRTEVGQRSDRGRSDSQSFTVSLPVFQTDRQSESQTVRQSDSQTVRQLESQKVRKSDSQTVRQSDSQAVRLSDSQTVRQSGSQAVRQSDSQTFKQSGCHTVRESNSQTATPRRSDGQRVRQMVAWLFK